MPLVVLTCLLLAAAAAAWVFSAGDYALAEPEREIRLQALRERRKAVYDNLKDLHFERLAGKLSEPDFQRTREMLELEAAEVNRALEKS